MECENDITYENADSSLESIGNIFSFNLYLLRNISTATV